MFLTFNRKGVKSFLCKYNIYENKNKSLTDATMCDSSVYYKIRQGVITSFGDSCVIKKCDNVLLNDLKYYYKTG